MTKIDLDVHKVTTGNILTILSIMAAAFVGYAKFESRVSVLETNVQWLVQVTANKYQVNPPSSAK
jgi:hypothetical protein